MQPELLKKIRRGIGRSVPFIGITTYDPRRVVKDITDTVIDKMESEEAQFTIVQWDICRGLVGVNEGGKKWIKVLQAEEKTTQAQDDDGTFNSLNQQQDQPMGNPAEGDPIGFLELLFRLPKHSIVFFHQANRFLDDTPDPVRDRVTIQAAANLRDFFAAQKFRTLFFLAPHINFPPELQYDVQVFHIPMPDRDELVEVVKKAHITSDTKGNESEAKLSKKHLERAVDLVTGMTPHGAKMAVTLSLPASGEPCDLGELRLRRHTEIEKTKGLSIYANNRTFADMAGYEWVREHFTIMATGKRPPKVYVHVDEINQALAGVNTESSGTTADALQVCLTNMERYEHRGMICYGPPGTGKTMLAETIGNTFGVDSIILDFGAAKGSHVSESEAYIRACLDVINAMGCNEVYWIGTCNKHSTLPDNLLRRFTDGIVYFDLPTEEELKAVWEVNIKRFGLEPGIHQTNKRPSAAGWSCADIRNCCSRAWERDITLTAAAEKLNPLGVAKPYAIAKYRKSAHKTLQSASTGDLYVIPGKEQDPQEVPQESPVGIME